MGDDLIERLRVHARGCSNEGIMKQWDAIRAMIVNGERSDLPRLCFESILDHFGEDAEQAADRITELEAELARLRAENEALRTERDAAVAAELLNTNGIPASLVSHKVAVDFARRADAAEAKAARLETALKWYEVQVGHCRKHTTDGFEARAALDADGGSRARAALEAKP